MSACALARLQYIRDAAEAIVRAAESISRSDELGARYFVGNQRLVTRAYFDLIARLSGQPRPNREAATDCILMREMVLQERQDDDCE